MASPIISTEDAGNDTAGSSAPKRRWRAHPDVAWVEGDNRIALLDLLDPQHLEPLICPEPLATLWRAVVHDPVGEEALLEIAVGEVGEDVAGGLLEAFVDALCSRGLIEDVA